MGALNARIPMVSIKGELQIHNFALELQRLKGLGRNHGQVRKGNRLKQNHPGP